MPREGKHFRFDDIEFWAEDGLVFIVDHRDGSCKLDYLSDFKKRAFALNEEAKRLYKEGKYPDEHKKMTDCVCSMRDCYTEAKDQGDPGDPKILAQKLKERRRTMMLIPGPVATLPTPKGVPTARKIILPDSF